MGPLPSPWPRHGWTGMTPRLMVLILKGKGKSVVRVDFRERPAGSAGSHRFDQQPPGHVVERPAVLPGELFQSLNDDVVQIANDDLVHGFHRFCVSSPGQSNRRIVSVYTASINPS